jgi:hypothetical protein
MEGKKGGFELSGTISLGFTSGVHSHKRKGGSR